MVKTWNEEQKKSFMLLYKHFYQHVHMHYAMVYQSEHYNDALKLYYMRKILQLSLLQIGLNVDKDLRCVDSRQILVMYNNKTLEQYVEDSSLRWACDDLVDYLVAGADDSDHEHDKKRKRSCFGSIFVSGDYDSNKVFFSGTSSKYKLCVLERVDKTHQFKKPYFYYEIGLIPRSSEPDKVDHRFGFFIEIALRSYSRENCLKVLCIGLYQQKWAPSAVHLSSTSIADEV